MKYISIFLFLTMTICANAQDDKTTILNNTKTAELGALASQLETDFKRSHQAAIQKALELGLDTINVYALSDQGDVIYMENDNVVSANLTNTDELHTGGSLGLNLEGTGITAGIWEATEQATGGNIPRTNHFNLGTGSTTRVTIQDGSTTSSNHATHVAGTMVGDGTNDVLAKGMAPDADLDAYSSANDLSEMGVAAANGMLISNHSYGPREGWRFNSTAGCWEWWGGSSSYNATGEDLDFGRYSSYAQSQDDIAHDAPYYLIVRSSGNDANDNPTPGGSTVRLAGNTNCFIYNTSVHPPGDGIGMDNIPSNAVSKNVLTVGATNSAGNGIAPFSSVGPVDDGRVKPDVVGRGVSVYSSGRNAQDHYYVSQGTSMAAPNVSGSAILLQEYHEDLFGSGNFMRSATLKALIIHTAEDLGNPGPDYSFGWGLMDTEAAAEVLQDANNNDGAEVMEIVHNGSFKQFGLTSSCAEDVRVTMGYTDLPGTVQTTLDNTTPNLVNDLDIRLVNYQSTEFPWRLNPAQPNNNATRGDNDVDNIEQIESVGNNSIQFLQITNEGALSGGQQRYSMIMSGINDVCQLMIAQGTSTLLDDVNFCSTGAMTSRATIPSGVTTSYTNHGNIKFLPGFNGVAGSSVRAYISPICN